MSKRPDFFKPLPSEKIFARRGGIAYSRESRERKQLFDEYRNAITALDRKVGDLGTYSGDGHIAGWEEAHLRQLDDLDAARTAFMDKLHSFAVVDSRPLRDRHGDIVTGPTPDKLERWPGETPDEHEYRLFKDFGIRIPGKSDPVDTDFPVDTAFFLPKPPDMTLELLTHIRDLLSQLVANQARPAVNLTSISQTLGDDPAKLWARLAGARGFSVPDEATAHETSPSVDGCGDPTAGDGPVAGAQEEAPATAGTDTSIGINTSPLVVHRTAALQDAVSARDAVFFRIRNLTARPISEDSYEQLAKLGEELGIKHFQVYRCTAQLEHARAAEVSLGEFGMFSNRRRPGARFSNPTPPAAPETPDAAQ